MVEQPLLKVAATGQIQTVQVQPDGFDSHFNVPGILDVSLQGFTDPVHSSHDPSQAHRTRRVEFVETGNMLYPHMNSVDRWLDSTRFFQGHRGSTERSILAHLVLFTEKVAILSD